MTRETRFYWGHRQAAQTFARQATDLTGGATVALTEGLWLSPDGTLLKEDAAVVTVLHDVETGSALSALADGTRKRFGELEVLVTQNTIGTLTLKG
jgi:hypothetical protein